MKRGGTWHKVSKAYRLAHPFCERCGALAEEVHHLIPWRANDRASRYDWENLRAVCKRCHCEIEGRTPPPDKDVSDGARYPLGQQSFFRGASRVPSRAGRRRPPRW
ncbi:MAG: hypothetical protein CBC48_07765 [bacterium TMED88]|nr:hypothetical protein [Deltaproteobacteria bacterium]OUV32764.1 MAG: hypothetical protein CBC48_07765 [bacterium TMED88]